MISIINSFMHEVAVLRYDALSLDIWFPTFQGKADISTSKSEIISYSLCCLLLSALPDWLLIFAC